MESAEALVRHLTPDNRSLLRAIRDAHPQSIAELARLTNRAGPNLLRTLGKLEAFGLLEMRLVDCKRVPTAPVCTFHLDIVPYAMNDKIEYRPSTSRRIGSTQR
jgi:predicted transcriptional regulator